MLNTATKNDNTFKLSDYRIWNLKSHVYDYDKKFTFTDKESYLEWVKQWKENYKTLSNDIRVHKKIRDTHGHENQAYSASHARYLGTQATEWLLVRYYSKVVSRQMYLASKVTLTV